MCGRRDRWVLNAFADSGRVAMSTATLSKAEHRPALRSLKHLGEMTVAMFVGMFTFGLVLGVIAGVAGSSLESIRVSQPELFMVGMGSVMSVTMVVSGGRVAVTAMLVMLVICVTHRLVHHFQHREAAAATDFSPRGSPLTFRHSPIAPSGIGLRLASGR
jgi:hypothetical protein